MLKFGVCAYARIATRRLGRGYFRYFSLSHKLLQFPVVVGRVLLPRHDIIASLCDSKSQRISVAQCHCSSRCSSVDRLSAYCDAAVTVKEAISRVCHCWSAAFSIFQRCWGRLASQKSKIPGSLLTGPPGPSWVQVPRVCPSRPRFAPPLMESIRLS
jgi:hypothetical protein